MQKQKTKNKNIFKKYSVFKLQTKGFRLKTASGFTVLFAALIGALVLSIGLAILNITLKQNILSSAGRKTQQSFYAADAGIECALFIDRGAGLIDSSDNVDPDTGCKLGYFGTPSTTAASGVSVCQRESTSFSPTEEYSCFGRKFTISRGASTLGADGSYTVVNQIELNNLSTFVTSRNPDMAGNPVFNENMCFVVDVIKILNNDNELTTKFESRGFNTCEEDSVNRFERAIRVINN